MKVVIANPKEGKSYQTEIDENKSKVFYGMKIGNEIDGSLIGLTGYKLKLTGGSDKEGFPMRPDVSGTDRRKVLLSCGPGFKKKTKGERRKKTVRGNIFSESINQVNVSVISSGPKPINELVTLTPKKEKAEKTAKK
ncbi:MAG: 30S ribosomal protein S6e [archaeon]